MYLPTGCRLYFCRALFRCFDEGVAAFDASATNAWRTSYAGQAATANGGGRQRPHQLLKFTDCACVAEAFSIHSRRF
jgi:hypothetical protein